MYKKDGNLKGRKLLSKEFILAQHALNYFIEHFSFIQFIVNFVKLPFFPSFFLLFSVLFRHRKGNLFLWLLLQLSAINIKKSWHINWIFLLLLSRIKRRRIQLKAIWKIIVLGQLPIFYMSSLYIKSRMHFISTINKSVKLR